MDVPRRPCDAADPRPAHRDLTPSPAALDPADTSGPTAPAVTAPGALAPVPRPASRC